MSNHEGTRTKDERAEAFVAASEADTAAAGRALAARAASGTTILLYGIDPAEVSSPTFTIVQEYRGPQVTLQHVDLYRLTPREITDLALEDLMTPTTVMAIEWADRLAEAPDGPVVNVRLEPVDGGRRISLTWPS